jgi:hypothetical protein
MQRRRVENMYKTSQIVQTDRKDSITVEMDGKKENVMVYVRNEVNKRVMNDALIELTPVAFLDLVYPILQEKGFILVAPLEGF